METFMILLVLLITNGEPNAQVVEVFMKAQTCYKMAAELNAKDEKDQYRFLCRPMSLTRA